MRIAFVEKRRDLVGFELRLRLLRRLLRGQRLLGLGLLGFVLLLELFGDRVWLRRLWLGLRSFFRGLQFFFLGNFGLGLFDRLARLLGFFLDRRLPRLGLGRVLDALGHLREILLADEVDGQRLCRRDIKALAGKR